MIANDLEVLEDDAEHSSEEDLIFDSIVSTAFEDSFLQPSVGPNCLVLYQFALSQQFSVGPNGEIYSNDV